MNLRLVSKLLGVVALLIGATMLFSMPWAHGWLGQRREIAPMVDFELLGFLSLLASVFICAVLGGFLLWYGRGDQGRLFRKEAMAVVGLSWVLATILGAMPFYFCGVARSSSVRVFQTDKPVQLYDFEFFGRLNLRSQWILEEPLGEETFTVVSALNDAGARGLSAADLKEKSKIPTAELLLLDLAETSPLWRDCIILPGEEEAPVDRAENYRFRWVSMGLADVLFESQSGFSTTGATVISDLEDPVLVPHCLLFWRSSTHFLGGLGIIVLFVAILGQGSAGKALMRTEMPGPTAEGSTARMQQMAWVFAGIYCALNAILALLLWLMGLTAFDALCHAFGTLATGGFSNYNASLGHFNSPLIEYTVIVFMILAGTNFALLALLAGRQYGSMLADVEWRTYMVVIALVTIMIVLFGMAHGDFRDPAQPARSASLFSEFSYAVRYSLFQVVSIMTTTGYGTHDFDTWNSFGRGVLFLLMFVGGCAGSTGGGLKVIRHVLFLKILYLDVERSFHPSVVRPLRLGGKPVDDPELRNNILVYFGLVLFIFIFSWLFVVTIEPDATWGVAPEDKLIDSASGVAATLNNIGPGLGTVGATKNYSHFSPLSKLLFVWLMMLGRLELFSILVLFSPAFWRNR